MATLFRGLQMCGFLSGRSFSHLTSLPGVHLQSGPSSLPTWSFWWFPPFLLVVVPGRMEWPRPQAPSSLWGHFQYLWAERRQMQPKAGVSAPASPFAAYPPGPLSLWAGHRWGLVGIPKDSVFLLLYVPLAVFLKKRSRQNSFLKAHYNTFYFAWGNVGTRYSVPCFFFFKPLFFSLARIKLGEKSPKQSFG